MTLNEKINDLKRHRKELIDSKIEYGGGLIFHYNSHHNDVILIEEVFGEDFFKNYLNSLDTLISKLEKEFNLL